MPAYGRDYKTQLQLGHGDEAVETQAELDALTTSTVKLQLGHGDEAVETYPSVPFRSAHSHCFNWATAMKPWRHSISTGRGRQVVRLQLGHGDEAVETECCPGMF